MTTSIPVQNLYYLFCYAWNRFNEGQACEVGTTESPDLTNLFAKVLINGTHHLLRRGLDRGYIVYEEDTACLRGRIVFGDTLKRNLLRQAKAHCAFDELSHDVVHNQVLKTTLAGLAQIEQIDPDLRDELRRLCWVLEGIHTTRISKRTFRQIQLHRNNAFYDFVIRVCELVFDSMLPEGNTGRFRFADILNDELKMGLVFQDFVRNFFRLEQSDFSVKSDRIRWDADADDTQQLELLPSMLTDVTLRSPERTIVIETKYYRKTMQEHHGRTTIRSENLYQLFSYLKNFEALEGPDEQAEGILLYPSVGRSLDVRYTIQGHPVRVCTIDLNQHWRKIHDDLLTLIN